MTPGDGCWTSWPATAPLELHEACPIVEPPIVEADTVGLPPSIAADLLEASRCCSFGAYRAAGLLARRVVEQVVVLRRVPLERRTLDQKLAWLLEAGHLPRALVADARAVRNVGNAATHGGEGVTAEEAWAGVRSAHAVAAAVLSGERKTNQT